MAARIRMRAKQRGHSRTSTAQTSAHQLGPGVVTRPWRGGSLAVIPRLLGSRRLRGRIAAGFRVQSTAGMRRRIGFGHWVRRHDLRPRAGCGRKHAVVPDEMESRRRHERCELFQDLERFKGHMGRSVAPRVLETVQQAAVGQQRETLGGHRRASAVAGEPLQALAIAREHGDVGVDADA